MEVNEAPEKIFLEWYKIGDKKYRDWCIIPKTNDEPVEYIRADAFIEKALKWYCLDCECNDNCKNTECFFKGQFRRYLKGNDNAIPPKICNRILNEDGTLSENWRYRHIIDALIDKAAKWIELSLKYYSEGGKLISTDKMIEDFKHYMKGEKL